ncbi:origin recognition complex subunit 4 [Aspergillus undulatus]|uniref:origin recognition complex subunit 4 n=1 Tax=Aspergillus undulatus TaxID=1810928 RepID=UPI003CCDEE63
MTGPRTAKRRRVSDTSAPEDDAGDGDGDITMQDADAVTAANAATPLKNQPATATATTTPASARAGTRSSGRQRKVPDRYEDTPVEFQRARSVRKAKETGTGTGTPRSTPKATSAVKPKSTVSVSKTASASARPSRRRLSGVSKSGTENGDENKVETEAEDDDAEFEDGTGSGTGSPQPPAKRVTRTRSKRNSVRFSGADAEGGDNADGDGDGESPDDFQDGLDDLVSMQLQQDLAREDAKGLGETTTTAGEDQEPLPAYAEQFQQFVRSGYEKEVRLLTKLVVEKLNGKRLVPLQGLDVEYHKVHHLVEQTVSVGEGNSMLLLGSRGSGKTAIIETIVSSLRKSHQNDFHVVRLNGFLHTDDRLALREIWQQLGRETATEEEAGKVTSYADTMATLLAMLSHPEELQASSSNGDGAKTTAKSIIIVLDEFDLFVTHPRQTLLYNLFDIAQARKAPLAVLGVTTKVDVTEMLEKRVKSRFSHRSVYVPLPRTFEIFSDACLAGLDLEPDLDLEDKTLGGSSFSVDDQSIASSDSWKRALDGWRSYLGALLTPRQS